MRAYSRHCCLFNGAMRASPFSGRMQFAYARVIKIDRAAEPTLNKKTSRRRGPLLRREGSNLRPSGYEPDELPLLYFAMWTAKVLSFSLLTKKRLIYLNHPPSGTHEKALPGIPGRRNLYK